MTKTNETAGPVSRRSFLRRGGAVAGGAAASTLLAAPAVLAQSPMVLKMQTSWPASDIWQTMAQQYVDRVEAMSGGRLKIDLLPAGAVVGAFQVMDGVSDGVIDIAHSVAAYWYGKNKAASLFGTGPVFGGDPTNMLSWFYQGGGQDLYRELTQDSMGLNVIGMFGFPMPAQPFGWFKNPINGVDDIKGIKYRTVGLAADLLQSMGMSVAQLPGGEIVPAMERGVIDAFEFNNPSSDMRFGAQDVAKNYYLGSYHQASEAFEFLFNRDLMETLDPDLRAILEHGVEAVSTYNTAFALDNYSSDLQKLRDGGVTVRKTPQDILSAQLDAWSEMITTLEQDPFIKKVLDSQRDWVKRTVFYELMDKPDYTLAYEHFFPGELKL
ncbi:MAG: TRAP transporter substrate-binding protein [Paracoccus sp. (in: a-proteobacteria)]|jgi:TRAP-type mannitol/chloroaromatic compound transport system substrate-binding protein|uniref:TRAP transporter substrate-binding protein n=1 Tax=unclassified Paracoccus (in: a-proteobacteria) TaxID=2688777 RepID=UPI000C69CD36|nr:MULTISPECIES: TRAP transporter substrate-binding protein [unclassified Paracoccus (in: a-proteobacteria)]MAN56769.1 C4-dicarboxylate ABC transporter [Paracoccus sp. (in: a-proteobacteria)]MDB2552000.1 TRAP transporter substrate-binding protein [Paracoccus sp. (in: a-proteobacteria)]|tara:strand:- start:2125 stop:3267 length:1143 start_codon:yes stop_codon:yes gene_type:complete